MKILFILLTVSCMSMMVTITQAQSQNQPTNATINNSINISTAEEMPVEKVNSINDPLLMDVQTKSSTNTIIIDGRKVIVDGQGVQSLVDPDHVKSDISPNKNQGEIPE